MAGNVELLPEAAYTIRDLVQEWDGTAADF
jgi:hypothetical protein